MPVLSLHYRPPKGRSFDLDYYRDRHLPMVRRIWGSHLQRIEVLAGTTSLDGSSEAPFCLTVLLYFASDAALNAALAHPETGLLAQDIGNFTSSPPDMQLNNIVVEPDASAANGQ